MNKRASTQIIALVVLIVISLAFAGTGFYLLQQERQKSLGLEEKLDEISTKQRITESRLDESKKLIVDLQLKYQEATDRINALTTDLEQEVKARLESEAKIEQMNADLNQQKELRSDLEGKLSKAQNDLMMTQGQLADLSQRKTELEAKVKDLEAKTQEIELGKIIVSPEVAVPDPKAAAKKTTSKPAAPKPVTYQGEVLVVNKEYSFAVINLGKKDKVELNQIYSVYRSNKYLGDIRIEKVHDTMSAAGFVTADLRNKIREGDKVAQKVK